MRKQTAYCLLLVVLASVSLFSCRKDPQPILEDEIVVPPGPSTPVKGFYLVNEGNMNMNRASLDFMDLQTGVYRRNIYNQANPSVVKGLGDVGNDAGVYGSKLYVVVNISNKVEVMDVKTGKRISQINITNCRYITFYKGKAYVSAYLGTVGDPSAPSGIVAEIDTILLTETRRINVGRQPRKWQ